MSVEQQPQSEEQPAERKGGLRIETEMWVRVVGRDNGATLRRGNICGSGFFFEADEWPGRTGDIGVLEVSSEDQMETCTTMASLVRVISTDEAQYSSTRQGVSYQFLPSDESTRVAIARLVRHIAQQHPEQLADEQLDDLESEASGGDAHAGAIGRSVIEAGAEVRLVVDATTSGGKREITGIVGDITESVQGDGTTRFWIPVFVEAGAQSLPPKPKVEAAPRAKPAPIEPAADSEGEDSLIDSMWKDLVPEARSIIAVTASDSSPTGKSHLSGRLSQISMPSALWLLDQERLTGALEFKRENEVIILYLSEGRVIDAESPNCEREPRAHLSALMAWDDGDFEFCVEEVDRPDRIGVPTQGLLLDLAVAADEEAR
jgi:hypothetical protein